MATFPEEETVPATVPPPPVRVKVELVSVAEFIASLNVACTVEVIATPVALLAGVTEETVGAVGGGAVTVPPPPPPHPARTTAVDTASQPNLKRTRLPLLCPGVELG